MEIVIKFTLRTKKSRVFLPARNHVEASRSPYCLSVGPLGPVGTETDPSDLGQGHCDLFPMQSFPGDMNLVSQGQYLQFAALTWVILGKCHLSIGEHPTNSASASQKVTGC